MQIVPALKYLQCIKEIKKEKCFLGNKSCLQLGESIPTPQTTLGARVIVSTNISSLYNSIL